jgi:uncharacterized sulfatase
MPSRGIAIVFLLVSLFFAAQWTSAEDRPPNFILVLADDLGIGDIGPYGNSTIRTPNLDRMAREGAALTSFYSAANICTPSRGGLLTGRYPARLGLALNTVAFPNNDIGLSGKEITIASALKPSGYATACIGKWHLGQKPDQWVTAHGFDYFYGLPYSNDMTPLALYRGNDIVEQPVDQTTLTERYTAEAIGFIEQHKDKPFFVYLAHSMPHVPLFVSKRFEGKSKAGLYGDVVETIDWSMGELFGALNRLGLDENTLVLFTSDNGPWWEGSAGAYRGRKGSAWEGGMRAPLIARWPRRIPAGVQSDAISMSIDLFPTILKRAGVELPVDREIDGRNIWPVLRGREESPHEYLYLFDGPVIAAVRSQRWKLVVQSWYRGFNAMFGNGYNHASLLFDLENDPEERYSQRRDNPEVVKQLADWLMQGRLEIERPAM